MSLFHSGELGCKNNATSVFTKLLDFLLL